MRHILTLIIILTLSLSNYGQSSQPFDIEEIFVTDRSQMKSPKDFIRCDSVFFQDEKYLVRRTCCGEWGGSVWFKNKNTGIEYSCSATCPVIINKIGEKYIVTSKLAHICGSSEVIEIEHPDSMDIFQLPPPIKKKRKKQYRYFGDNQSRSKKGTKILVDTICALIQISFPYEEQLYHIVSGYSTLYLSHIKNNKLVTIDTIYTDLGNFNKKQEGILYSYSAEAFKTKDNHYIVLYENKGFLGYLDIYENKIRLIRYK